MKTREHTPAANAVAYSYLRFSSPEQAKGDSIRRQTEMTKAWCERTGVRYDESLSLRDEGKSAFTGEHRKNPDRHALAGFLELVRLGRVPRGSYFIIENLDRLTREDTVPAVNLFTGILLSGVRIVQLDPETIYTDKSDSMDVMRAVLEMSRGHSESANKSRRMSAVWNEKRKQAAAAGKVMTRSCPAWIRVEGTGDDARYVLIRERAMVVKRIFRLATDGYGVRAIHRRLIADKVPPFRDAWNVSYLKLLLKSRQTFGEFTPRERGKGGNSLQRKAVGSPIPNYYPPAITQEEFFAVQAATETRKGRPGRPAKEFTNVFSGIIWDARTQSPLHLTAHHRDGKKCRYLAPYAAINRGAKRVGFSLDVFEDALLNFLDGIDPRAILPAAEGAGESAMALEAKEKDILAQLARLKSRLKAEDEVATIMDTVRELEAERKANAAALAELRQREAAPTSGAWREFKSIAAALDAAPDKDAARVRLRAVLRRMLEGIWCLFMPAGEGPRVARVQVVFSGGEKFQQFIIAYRPKNSSRGGAGYPAEYVLREATTLQTFDIRDADNARAMEAALAAVRRAVWNELIPSRDQRAIRSKAYRQKVEASRSRAPKWRAMREKGMSYAAIAEAEGVSTNTVHYTLNGKKPKKK